MIMNENDFGLYSKIQDQLMILGNNQNIVSLSVSVVLLSSRNNRNEYYYKEFQYISEKLNCETRKIRREFDCFLHLENVKPMGDYREYIVIRAKDLELCRLYLLPKLEDLIKNFDQIYQVQGNKIHVAEYRPFMIEVGSKSLLFQPGLNKTFTDEIRPVVDMFMNSRKENQVSISFDQLYGLMYILRTFDLYGYASSMLSYMGRPPTETNLINLTGLQEQGYIQEQVPIPINASKRRVIGGEDRKNKNYFTKDM